MTRQQFEFALSSAIDCENHCDFPTLLILVDMVYQSYGFDQDQLIERAFQFLAVAPGIVAVLKARWLCLELRKGFDDGGEPSPLPAWLPRRPRPVLVAREPLPRV